MVLAVLLAVAPSPCFALWEIAPVSKERAKELGMEIRAKAAGLNSVWMELEFKTEGKFQRFSHVDLRIGEGGKSLVIAPLRENRSKRDASSSVLPLSAPNWTSSPCG